MEYDLTRKCLVTDGCLETLDECSKVYNGVENTEECLEEFQMKVNAS